MNYDLERQLAKSRDPVDWLVLADLYEDEGEDYEDQAKDWRGLAEVGQAILSHILELALIPVKSAKSSKLTERFVSMAEIRFILRKTNKLVIVEVGHEHAEPWRSWLIMAKWLSLPIANKDWRTIRYKLRQMADLIAAKRADPRVDPYTLLAGIPEG